MRKRFFSFSFYTLGKAKRILRYVHNLYRRKKHCLTPSQKHHLKMLVDALQEEIDKKNSERAHDLAKQVEALSFTHLKKTAGEKVRDTLLALGLTLILAIFVRQLWFEFYEIPSGSMRPTLKEKDRLVVSKAAFGINIPLRLGHFYFNPEGLKRGHIVIFTGEKMDIRDVDTRYFYLFPGKKQYIKRLMGKPGDTLYFYGGRLYGINSVGKDISSELQIPELEHLEHIPFTHFEGKIVKAPFSTIYLQQMHEPLVRFYLDPYHKLRSNIVYKSPTLSFSPKEYGEIWGFKHFAMARLLSREELRRFHPGKEEELGEGVLYLELHHHPRLPPPQEQRTIRLEVSKSLLPLQETHLRKLMSHLYTARFTVKNGIARRYGLEKEKNSGVPLSGIPDGCYEFYYGIAYKIGWQGIAQKVPDNHALYRVDAHTVQTLFNLGLDFDMRFQPQSKNEGFLPARYAYYRDQNLYLLGSLFLSKEDPLLQSFVEKEEQKVKHSLPFFSYIPFKDHGPPLTSEGTLDAALIKRYGFTVPEKHYLVLGDNHAMSADSRDFGCVSQDNLRGAAQYILWPPGSRWGKLDQPDYPPFSLSQALMGGVVGGSVLLGIYLQRRKNTLPLVWDL